MYNWCYERLNKQEAPDDRHPTDTTHGPASEASPLIQQVSRGWHPQELPVPGAPLSIVDFDEMVDGLTPKDYENFALVKEYEVAPNSRRNYRYQWGRWEEWADGRGVQAVPANPLHVKAYLIERLLTLGHKPATLRVAAAGISHIHRENGWPDPCADNGVRATLNAAGRISGWKQKQAKPLTMSVFWEIITVACRPRAGRGGNPERPETALRRGRVDIAIIGLMRDCMLRISEAAAAVWGDLVVDPDGSGTLWIPESKTDQEGEGEVGYISRDTVRSIEAIRDGAPADANIFGLRPNQISKRIKRAALEAGCGEGFSGHSPRVGMAIDLARAGTSLPRLMNAGRWQSPSMPARYIRAEIARRNAVAEFYNPPEGGIVSL